jgi:hypothetical protein
MFYRAPCSSNKVRTSLFHKQESPFNFIYSTPITYIVQPVDSLDGGQLPRRYALVVAPRSVSSRPTGQASVC